MLKFSAILFIFIISHCYGNIYSNITSRKDSKESSLGQLFANDCPRTPQTVGTETIYWDKMLLNDREKYLSTPICLDVNFNFVTRLCKNGIFENEPNCIHIQQQISDCHEDLISFTKNGQTICYTLRGPSTYPGECPYNNREAISTLTDLITSEIESIIWYPATRFKSYGVTNFFIDEPKWNYKQELTGITYPDGINGKDCIIRKMDGKLQAVACSEKYHTLCAYKPLQGLENSYCQFKNRLDKSKTCYNRDFEMKTGGCFCIKDTDDCQLANFLYPYQNTKVSKGLYKIGLVLDGNRFKWESRNALINYGYWSNEISVPWTVGNTFIGITGWTPTTKVTPDKYVCEEEEHVYPSPVMTLIYPAQNGKFELTITNHESIIQGSDSVFCFTDGLAAKIIHPVKTTSVGNIKYYMIKPETTRGYYWCEAFSYPNSKLITSERILLEAKNNYVVTITAKYHESDDPTGGDYVNTILRGTIAGMVPNKVRSVSWSKTLEINENRLEATYSFHLYTDSTLEDNEAELKEIEEALRIGNEIIVDMSEVYSSYYCRSLTAIESGGYPWKLTKIGEEASYECPGEEQVSVVRQCQGSFNDGAKWKEVEGTCLNNNNGCTSETEQVGDVTITWNIPLSSDNSNGIPYLSSPLCLNKNYNYLTRTCIDGEFLKPLPFCEYTQTELSYCPEDFQTFKKENGDTLCYYLSKATTYPGTCLYPNQEPIITLVQFIQKKVTEPIWYPATRLHEYGVTHFVHDEHSTHYQRTITGVIYPNDEITGKDCLTYDTRINEKFVAVSCTEKYKRLCAYKPVQHQEGSYCQVKNKNSICFNSDFDMSDGKCFCEENTISCKLAEFIYPYQSTIPFSTGARSDSLHYKIGLIYDPDEDVHKWERSGTRLSYSYWSEEILSDSYYEMFEIGSTGWFPRASDALSERAICEQLNEFQVPTLTLSIVSTEFQLVITKPTNLVYNTVICFTDSISSTIITIITPRLKKTDELSAVYVFQPLVSGYYWCHAFYHPQYTRVSSNKVLTKDNNNYVVTVIAMYEKGEDPTSTDFFQQKVSAPITTALSNIPSAVVKWSKVLEVNDVTMLATFSLHIYTGDKEINNEEELNYIHTKLQSATFLINRIVSIGELYSSYYCKSTQVNEDSKYHWGLTSIDTTASTKCLNGDDTLSRQCEGSFMDGAKWSMEIKGICPEFFDCDPVKQLVGENEDMISWETKISTTPIDVTYLSYPLCLDENFNILSRKCINNKFEQEPPCAIIQKTISYCPENFEEYNDLCYIITDETSKHNCPFPNYETYKTVYDLLLEVEGLLKEDEYIWIPASRYSPYGFTDFYYNEYSHEYRDHLSDQIEYVDSTISDKDCLIGNKNKLKAVPCSDKYKNLCVYKPLHSQEGSYCSQRYNAGCYNSDFDMRNGKCFCRSTENNCKLAEFLKPYQNLNEASIQVRNDITYKIGLGKNLESGTYQWISNQEALLYSYWSDKVLPDENGDVFIAKFGWVQKEDSLNTNVICQYDIAQAVEPELTLEYTNEKFLVTLSGIFNVANRFQQVYCFTDTADDFIISKITVTTDTVDEVLERATFFFVPDNLDAGTYWCESFIHPNLQIIKSNVVTVDSENNYVIFVTAKYGINDDPTNQNFVKYTVLNKIREILQSGSTESRTFEDSEEKSSTRVKWTRTIGVNDEEMTARYILHLVSTDDEEFNDDKLSELNDKLQQQQSANDLEISEVYSSYYCKTINVDEQNNYKWQSIEIGQEAYSPCLEGQEKLKRTCVGDFINGGKWSEITGECNENHSCESNSNQDVLWDTKVSIVDLYISHYISNPKCLDKYFNILSRECIKGEFQPEPKCEHIQKPPSHCPDGFQQHTSENSIIYCYKLTELSSYPPSCPYANTVSFNTETLIIIQNKITEPVWYPATRNLQFGYSYMIYDEVSFYYKMYLNNVNYEDGQFSKRDCVIIKPDGTLVAEPCSNEYRGICVYLALGYETKSYCSIKYGDNCFNNNLDLNLLSCDCIEESTSSCSLAHLFQPYQNYMITSDVAYDCQIALSYNEEANYFYWTKSNRPLTYSYWSNDISLKSGVVSLTPQGWNLKDRVKDPLTSRLCEKNPKYIKPMLQISKELDKFYVTLTNPAEIIQRDGFDVFCFTDVASKYLITRVSTNRVLKDMDTYVYYFTEINPNPGHYWCEAFSYPNFSPIKTTTFLYETYNNYPFKVHAIFGRGENPIPRQFVIDYIIDPIQSIFTRNEVVEIRWMKTLEIDDMTRTVTYLLHLTTRTKESDELELETLNNALQNRKIPSLHIKNIGELYSSSYCKSDSPDEDNVYLWSLTPIGQEIFADNTCVQEDGSLVKRRCMGDFLDGGYWEAPNGECFHNYTVNNNTITHELYDLLKSNATSEELVVQLENLTERQEEYVVFDVYLTSLILHQINHDVIQLKEISRIINNVVKVNNTIMESSQVDFNSTDKILDEFDAILINQLVNETGYTFIELDDVVVLQFDPNRCIITGIALYQYGDSYQSQLLLNTLIDLDLLPKHDLLIATHIPNALLDQIYSLLGPNDSFIVSITIFKKGTLFNEYKQSGDWYNGAFNIGIILPKIKVLFDYSIPIIFRPNNENDRDNCAYWKYGLQSDSTRGKWETNSEPKGSTYLRKCEFFHTTHYGLMVSGNMDDTTKDKVDNSAIVKAISSIQCLLSLVGIACIFATAIILPTWRRNKGNQILVHFGIVTFFQIGLLYISGEIKISELGMNWCLAAGVTLHYSVISQFGWMLVIAHLQYRRFVLVFMEIQTWVILKACCVGYLLPMIPVVVLLVLAPGNYENGDDGICYPTGDGLKYAIFLPVGIIVVINILIFSIILWNIFIPRSNVKHMVETDLLFLRFKLVFLLFFMLGFTWIFGFLGQLLNEELYVHLFSLTSSLQGFIIFLFFIVFNKHTRMLYVYSYKKYRTNSR